MSHSALADWAVPQLSKLLPLDEESLKQVVTYTDTLSRVDAAEHLKNLLGDSPQALEFISSFQSRRPTPPSEVVQEPHTSSRDVSESEVPRAARGRQKKKKSPFNALPPPRQVEQSTGTSRAYVKRDESDYMSFKKSNKGKAETLSSTLALQSEPDALQLPISNQRASKSPTRGAEGDLMSQSRSSNLPPSAAGTLISDNSRSASPSSSSAKQASKTKVNLTGGTSMRGASTTLSDLDNAIRALELQTNPTLGTGGEQDNKQRRCNCMAQRHPLLAAAPNCLSCGKIVCLKEGLGPCTFCGQPLLRSEDLQAMIRFLREERGKEKMEANNASHKRPDVTKTPRPFTSNLNSSSNPGSSSATPALSRSGTPTPDPDEERLAAAKAHRDKLLRFQAQNTQRTTIRDEASDFSTPDDGQNLWATPQERALQLKKQQKALREQEWNSKPEWEKKRVVVSIDVKGGKAVRRMAEVERPDSPESLEEDEIEPPMDTRSGNTTERGTGKFSRNPLLGGLIKPVFQLKGKERPVDKQDRKVTWRRVQDDNEDNEAWILDGGAYGEMIDGRVLASEEPACG